MDLKNYFWQTHQEAAQAILDCGAFATNFKDGFELAAHQQYPDAPRSPFFINLRPKGEVKQDLVGGLGKAGSSRRAR